MTQAHDSTDVERVAARLRAALGSGDLAALASVLADNVRWEAETDTPDTCHGRAQVLDRLARQQTAGMVTEVLEVVPANDAVLLALNVKHAATGGFSRERTVYQVLKVRGDRVTDIRGYGSRAEAAAEAGLGSRVDRALEARQVVPILNVSSLADSFEWFARLGWRKNWDWGEASGPPSFGSVGSGACELFLCLNGQGGRGRDGGIGGDGQGVWLSIWIDDVDALHAVCEREAIEVLQPPRNEPWGVREMHIPIPTATCCA